MINNFWKGGWDSNHSLLMFLHMMFSAGEDKRRRKMHLCIKEDKWDGKNVCRKKGQKCPEGGHFFKVATELAYALCKAWLLLFLWCKASMLAVFHPGWSNLFPVQVFLPLAHLSYTVNMTNTDTVETLRAPRGPTSFLIMGSSQSSAENCSRSC